MFVCGGEKTRELKRKTKERKESNIRNKKSKLSNITMIFSQ